MHTRSQRACCVWGFKSPLGHKPAANLLHLAYRWLSALDHPYRL
jgi:hypothetical protein